MAGKRMVLFIPACLLCLVCSFNVAAQEQEQVFDREQIIREQMEALDFEKIEAFIADLNRQGAKYVPEINLQELVARVARGEEAFNLRALLGGLLQYLFQEVVANSHLLGKLLLLAVIAAVLNNIQQAFTEQEVGQVAYSVCFLVLLAMAVQTFTIAINTGQEAVERMVTFMQALLPVLLALLTAVGGIASAAVFHPLLLMIISILATVIESTIFPLIYIAAILAIVSQLSSGVSISRLAGLIQEGSVVLLGLAISIFIGVIVVQGVAASVSDGVSLRTVKFLAGTFVPLVGKMLADTIDAVASCSLLLKNAIGLVGVLAVILLCSFPILKLAALILIYKVAAAAIQPITEGRLVQCLNSLANSLTVVLVSIATVAIMFFITITVIIGVGNMTVMLR
ncbi:MAG TPA: stage III sporulation protein AE [Firmicutes bacterium]|jgi:stage III sporulation protein AE|nr:stage III sporulation protein AE [Bacillota bacterium]